MHQRTWLSLISLPLVAAFTWPVVTQNLGLARQAPRQEAKAGNADPLAGLADIQDVLGIVRENYVDRPDMEKVVSGGIMATLERAHPLNAYLSAEDLRLPDPGPAGLGMKVLKRGLYAQILAVRPGSPAAVAGLQAGDVIRKIDGESVGQMSAWALERRLHGTEGSDVALLRNAAATGNLGKLTLRRALPGQPAVEIRREEKLNLVAIPDFGAGRTEELKAVLAGLDHAKPLVLDLRNCMGGELAEAAQAAGLFATTAVPMVTVQEPGAREGEVRESPVAAQPAGLPAFARVAMLLGPSAFGAPEALASCLKKAGFDVFGERSSGLGVERTRINLRQGGAVEIVTKRWLGAGGEKLDRAGVEPTIAIKGLKPGEDPLPKLLPLLEAKPGAKVDKAPAKAASLRPRSSRALAIPEVA